MSDILESNKKSTSTDTKKTSSSYHYLDPSVRRFQFKIGGKAGSTLKMQKPRRIETFDIKHKPGFEKVNKLLKNNTLPSDKL